ncbi:MAG TPA: hypothetical protein VLG10_09250 [Methylomirabilota bacterium]|nr:hypothetical protein [Methylomirabilota bacterium]
MDADRDAPLTASHGTALTYARAPDGVRRRILEVDRRGTPLADLRWGPGALSAAWVRIPDGGWLAVEPRATEQPPWGLVDRIARAARVGDHGTPVTVFEALDWGRIDRIPTLAEPGKLPPGGGVAVLNLIAALALDQNRPPLAYRGPYPSEQLFLALLESFRYTPADTDPLAAFAAGRLKWIPAPHERVFETEGVYVQVRGRVEKVVWRGRAYYRPDWQDVVRHAPRRVWEADDGLRCSIWALGGALEDHLRLTPAGEVTAVVERARSPEVARRLDRAVAAGIGAAVAAQSAAPLARLIREHTRALPFEWGLVDGDLVEVDDTRARVSARLRGRLAAALAAADTPEARAAVALAALTEIALTLGDALRAHAQSRLATLPEDEQRACLTTPCAEDPAADARVIMDGVRALLTDLTPPRGR